MLVSDTDYVYAVSLTTSVTGDTLNERGGEYSMSYTYIDHPEHIELLASIRAHGVVDERVLAAMRAVPRHEFVPFGQRRHAYEDVPLPIGEGQTISQPSLVAQMTHELGLMEHERVLEIGTGSGYQAAILAQLAKEVYTVERIPSLTQRASKVLQKLGYTNIHVYLGNGTWGLPAHAPYDAIIVTAASPQIPEPLKEQLAEGGRMVIPVGESVDSEVLMVCVKQHGQFRMRYLEPVRFVPLIGDYGWPPMP